MGVLLAIAALAAGCDTSARRRQVWREEAAEVTADLYPPELYAGEACRVADYVAVEHPILRGAEVTWQVHCRDQRFHCRRVIHDRPFVKGDSCVCAPLQYDLAGRGGTGR